MQKLLEQVSVYMYVNKAVKSHITIVLMK